MKAKRTLLTGPASSSSKPIPAFTVEAELAHRADRQVDVDLVSMPWTSLNEPSLGLGVLASVLAADGLIARVRHLNLQMLRFLRPATYRAIAETFALNDFLFTAVLDPHISTRQWGWLRSKARGLSAHTPLPGRDGQQMSSDSIVDELIRLRSVVIPTWLEEQAAVLAASSAPLLGFTCMFDQTIASVALGYLVKHRRPDKLIVLGGYAVREPTGATVLKAFPWLDAICTGEGEAVITPLAHAAAGSRPLADVPGIMQRDSQAPEKLITTSAQPIDLQTSPYPCYDDFFMDVADLSKTNQIDITVSRLPIENSRGCWWGQIQHCIFCGIHDDDLRFRAKPGPQVADTMDQLSQRYQVSGFRFSDYILPRQYFDTLLPDLARRGAPYAITAELKANLSERHFAVLKAAGFSEVQPGIESFSSRALKYMDKGTSPLQNVHTLMLGRRYGVRVNWNLLYGFPDDDPDDMEHMLDTLARLVHLDPPATRLPVQVTRFAPLHTDPARFAIPSATYEPSYDLVFSPDYLDKSGFRLRDYCYYFMRPFMNSPRLTAIYGRIDALVDRWRAGFRADAYTLTWKRNADGSLVVTDTRYLSPRERTRLGFIASKILLALTRPRSLTDLIRAGELNSPQAVSDVLLELEECRFVVRDADRWISIVCPPRAHAKESGGTRRRDG